MSKKNCNSIKNLKIVLEIFKTNKLLYVIHLQMGKKCSSLKRKFTFWFYFLTMFYVKD